MFEYKHGYWKALTDLKAIFERSKKKMMAETPKGKKKNLYSHEGIISLLEFLIENTEALMQLGDTFKFWYGCDENGNFIFKIDDGTEAEIWEKEVSEIGWDEFNRKHHFGIYEKKGGE